jgi:hypothetical protein
MEAWDSGIRTRLKAERHTCLLLCELSWHYGLDRQLSAPLTGPVENPSASCGRPFRMRPQTCGLPTPEKLMSRALEQLISTIENSVHMLQLDALTRHWLLSMPSPRLASTSVLA